ncbi:hypothetical protein JXA48_01300 [Candidatus Woesearchaeota archaeon]|nr:hypothetical protein [Candidatus Woesearchaeota archaeon]
MVQPMGMPPPQMPGGMPPMGGMSAPMQSEATNEELIEAIIDEKWNDLLRDINKIIDWKSVAESRLSSMEQEIKDLRAEYDKLHQAVVGKVGEYDKHILDVGAEIQAMEKVFAKVLPLFTEKVSDLARITDDLKATTGNRQN